MRPTVCSGKRCVLALWLLVLTLAATPAGAAGPEARYEAAAERFHTLRDADEPGPQAWRDLAADFLAIHDDAPRHRRGPDALFSAALCYRKAWHTSGEWRDLSRAAETFRGFVSQYPADRLADDSLVHLAGLQRDGFHDAVAAAELYERVIAQHADGDQVPTARHRLAALRQAVGAEGQAEPVAFRVEPAADGAARPDKEIRRVQVWSTLTWTRVILSTSLDVTYRYARLAPRDGLPERVYFDLLDTRPDEDVPAERAVDDPIVSRVRVNRFANDVTRLVLDLDGLERMEVKDYRLPTEQKIVVDLYPQQSPVVARTPAPATSPAVNRPGGGVSAGAAAERGIAPPQADDGALGGLTLASSLGLKVRRIMLDPGHGGHDPGAVAHGVEEADLVLEIAERLRDIIRREHPEIAVGMTRDRDVFIPLQERPVLAKDFRADLFVSIHLNANPITRFHGVETYFLNLTSDGSALQVAARENATTEKRVSDLNTILFDLLRDSNIVESSKLADTLQTSLVSTLRGTHGDVRDLGVKQAPFLVLMGAEMPSVLVEAGFLTNPRENDRLQRADYLQRVAKGIYRGLQRYIQERNIVQGPDAPEGRSPAS